MATRVLIVEDDGVLRDLLVRMLSPAGFFCIPAGSAEEALERLETEPADVLITDIRLPGMSGLDLTEKLVASADMVALVVTGFIDEYTYAHAIEKGASDFIMKPIRAEEIVLRINRAVREQEHSRERTRALEQIRKLAITDELTQLFNSRHFYSQLKIEIDRANRYKRDLALLLLDIDHFKEYNDQHGHLEGNIVLSRIGTVVTACLRTMDSAYRYGGEEFTLILPETDMEAAKTVAERLRVMVETQDFHPGAGERTGVTISLGITQYVEGEELSVFVQRSDQAMYKAKESGRNRTDFLLA